MEKEYEALPHKFGRRARFNLVLLQSKDGRAKLHRCGDIVNVSPLTHTQISSPLESMVGSPDER